MLYFAYGSNLSSARLQKRVPSGKLLDTGIITRHRLVFHKIGRDGSAKCDAYCTGILEDYILGAVYRIDPQHKELLDKAEGLGKGYAIKYLEVLLNSGSRVNAFLYSATRIDTRIKPFHWYKEHVLRGMREHNFPEHYCECLKAVKSVEDHDPGRAKKEMCIYNSGAGIDSFRVTEK